MRSTITISLAVTALAATAFVTLRPEPTRIDNFEMTGERIELKNEPAKWSIDKKHSNVGFNVNYMGLTQLSGKFTAFEGTLETSKADFSDAVINFTVDATSINTDDQGRDNHLKSDDFFSAEKFPAAKFTSTSFTPVKNNMYQLKGDLTIRDVTKPVVFDVKYGGSIKDARGGSRAGFMARTTINRFDYGVKWENKTPEGTLVVDKDVELVLNIQMRLPGQKQ